MPPWGPSRRRACNAARTGRAAPSVIRVASRRAVPIADVIPVLGPLTREAPARIEAEPLPLHVEAARRVHRLTHVAEASNHVARDGERQDAVRAAALVDPAAAEVGLPAVRRAHPATGPVARIPVVAAGAVRAT